MKRLILLLTIMIMSFAMKAQVQDANFTVNPPAFNEDEQITVTVSGIDTSVWGVNDVYLWAWYLNPDGSFGDDSPNNGSWTNSDESQKMTDNGDGTFSITFTPTNFYNTTNIGTLGMLVKAKDGTGDKKTQDFLIDVGAFQLFLDSPTEDVNIVNSGTNINISATISLSANVELIENGNVIDTQNNTTSYNFNYTANNDANLELVATEAAGSGQETEEFTVVITPNVTEAPVPAGMEDGINYDPQNNPDEITLVLFAPNKNFVHVIGNFNGNDWTINNTYLMNRESSTDRYWITIDGLNNAPTDDFLFQYVVDGEINIADPYSKLVLDNFNDPFIEDTKFPGIPEYPESKTSQLISWVRLNQAEYQWQVNNFQRPDQENLVIYELLTRDFDTDESFEAIIQRLDYLEGLGINAIELMPVNEFDGNISWGYAPALHMALDKYYGSPEKLKEFVDECHMRGIAVLLDVTYNHATGQHPYFRMYNDCNGCLNGQATADNPLFNVTDPNTTFSFFNDIDHENQFTEDYLDRMNKFWLEEYNIDGYRFDFTKGFTNVPGDGGGFDQSRINNLNRMFDEIRVYDQDAYVILEHFAPNSEETNLINHSAPAAPNAPGMMVWANFVFPYAQASMGFDNSDFSGMDYESRGWSKPSQVAYMESHDEERMMFRNANFGNSLGSYDIQNLSIGLDRVELASSFFFPIPGPKMIWQFGELGYDYSIDQCPDGTIDGDCRTAPKPIPWEEGYQNNSDRTDVYDTFSKLIKLKMNNEIFETDNFTLEVSDQIEKKIFLVNDNAGPDELEYVTIVGNFGLFTITTQPFFQETGTWYNLLDETPFQVNDVNQQISLTPGEFIVFGNELATFSTDDFVEQTSVSIYPNPATTHFSLSTDAEQIQLFNLNGQKVKSFKGKFDANHKFEVGDLAKGIYLVKLINDQKSETVKLMIN